jgi:hypothetical protein
LPEDEKNQEKGEVEEVEEKQKEIMLSCEDTLTNNDDLIKKNY